MKKKWIDIRNGREIELIDRYNYGYIEGSHFVRENLGGVYNLNEEEGNGSRQKREEKKVSHR